MRIPTSTARANMPLFRILILAIVLWIVYRLIKRVIGPVKSERKQPINYEDMVSCSHCNLHLPRSQAIIKSGKVFCCAEHADKADTPQP